MTECDDFAETLEGAAPRVNNLREVPVLVRQQMPDECEAITHHVAENLYQMQQQCRLK